MGRHARDASRRRPTKQRGSAQGHSSSQAHSGLDAIRAWTPSVHGRGAKRADDATSAPCAASCQRCMETTPPKSGEAYALATQETGTSLRASQARCVRAWGKAHRSRVARGAAHEAAALALGGCASPWIAIQRDGRSQAAGRPPPPTEPRWPCASYRTTLRVACLAQPCNDAMACEGLVTAMAASSLVVQVPQESPGRRDDGIGSVGRQRWRVASLKAPLAQRPRSQRDAPVPSRRDPHSELLDPGAHKGVGHTAR